MTKKMLIIREKSKFHLNADNQVFVTFINESVFLLLLFKLVEELTIIENIK